MVFKKNDFLNLIFITDAKIKILIILILMG